MNEGYWLIWLIWEVIEEYLKVVLVINHMVKDSTDIELVTLAKWHYSVEVTTYLWLLKGG